MLFSSTGGERKKLYLKKLMKTNSTYASIFWIGASTLIAGVINYFYHPVMLRFMSMETFGEFSSMMGIFNILGVLTAGVGLFLVAKVAQNKENQSALSDLFSWAFPRSVLLGGGMFVLFLLFFPLLKSYLRLDANVPLLLVGLSLLFAFPSTLLSSVLQGKESFKVLAFNSIFSAIAKFAMGVGLAFFGRGIYAAVGGLLGGAVLSLLFLLWWVATRVLDQVSFFSLQGEKNQSLTQDFIDQLTNVGQMLGLVLLLAFFMNGDVILARNLFDPQSAGIYGGVAIVGKFVMFVAGAIETVYYPKITQHSSPARVPFAWIKNPSILLLVMMGTALLGTFLLGDFVLEIMKPELAQQGVLLMRVVVMAGFYGFVSFYGKILVAWKDAFVLWILTIGAVLGVALLYLLQMSELQLFVLTIVGIEGVLALMLFFRISYLHTHALLAPMSKELWNEKSEL